MAKITVKVKGIKDTLKDFSQFGKEAEKEVSEITIINANEITANAKIAAPGNIGKLHQNIYTVELDKLNYKVVVGVEYGAYVEFGTGRKVSVPKEFQDQADKFRNQGGSFEEGLQAIRDWCRQKRIDEDAAYPIFISILNNGIEPQPFLYPAYVKGKKTYVKGLNKALDQLVKKYE